MLITSGAQQAIALLTMLHVRADDTVVTEALTHTGAIDLLGAAGAQIRTVDVGADGADVDAIAARLAASPRPRMLYLIPSIHNPLGVTMPARHRRRLAEVVADHPDVVVVSDDTLADTYRDRRPPPPLASYPGAGQVLHVGSLSKLLWAGVRIGWIRGPAVEVRRLARLKALSDLGTSVPGQLLALRLLQLGEAHEDERRALIAMRGRHLEQALAAALPDWQVSTPEGGLALWVRLPHGTAKELAIRAARHGVAVAPGSVQSPEGRFGDHVRLPYGHPRDVLDQAVRRLARAWRGAQPGPPAALDDLHVVV